MAGAAARRSELDGTAIAAIAAFAADIDGAAAGQVAQAAVDVNGAAVTAAPACARREGAALAPLRAHDRATVAAVAAVAADRDVGRRGDRVARGRSRNRVRVRRLHAGPAVPTLETALEAALGTTLETALGFSAVPARKGAGEIVPTETTSTFLCARLRHTCSIVKGHCASSLKM